uniref:Uncharacterized protein n=1 Tax=viral metagenome TaxID=1070528 RepID=A0A6H1ZFV3_9ZZZZ
MDKNDYLNFSRLMALMQEMFVPDKTISKAKVSVYFDLLKDLNIEDILIAVEAIIREKKYPVFPLIGEIREMVSGRMEDNVDLEAQVAWGTLLTICDRMGFDEPVINDPVLSRAIRTAFGSVKRFGELPPEMEATDRKHFISCYKRIATRERSGDRQLESTLIKELLENRKQLLEYNEKQNHEQERR